MKEMRAVVNRCVVLGVDTASRSGWSIWMHGSLIDFGELNVENLDEVLHVCERAVELGRQFGVPAVLVTERAWGGNRPTMLGLGGALKIWQVSWVKAGGQKSKRIQVYPATWRARIIGRGMVRARREVTRKIEQATARAIVGNDEPIGDDAAPGICIGKWGCWSIEVHALLPKRFQQEAMVVR
jgi:hypothetical protein